MTWMHLVFWVRAIVNIGILATQEALGLEQVPEIVTEIICSISIGKCEREAHGTNIQYLRSLND